VGFDVENGETNIEEVGFGGISWRWQGHNLQGVAYCHGIGFLTIFQLLDGVDGRRGDRRENLSAVGHEAAIFDGKIQHLYIHQSKRHGEERDTHAGHQKQRRTRVEGLLSVQLTTPFLSVSRKGHSVQGTSTTALRISSKSIGWTFIKPSSTASILGSISGITSIALAPKAAVPPSKRERTNMVEERIGVKNGRRRQ
jgi:hypothetical protein